MLYFIMLLYIINILSLSLLHLLFSLSLMMMMIWWVLLWLFTEMWVQVYLQEHGKLTSGYTVCPTTWTIKYTYILRERWNTRSLSHFHHKVLIDFLLWESCVGNHSSMNSRVQQPCHAYKSDSYSFPLFFFHMLHFFFPCFHDVLWAKGLHFEVFVPSWRS